MPSRVKAAEWHNENSVRRQWVGDRHRPVKAGAVVPVSLPDGWDSRASNVESLMRCTFSALVQAGHRNFDPDASRIPAARKVCGLIPSSFVNGAHSECPS